MDELISRQEAIDVLCHVDEYNGRSVEAIRNLPSAQSETDDLDAVRRARRILWDKCKKYLVEHTDEICPLLHGKYEEEYTGMTNDVQALSRAIYIMEGMKNRGEIR